MEAAASKPPVVLNELDFDRVRRALCFIPSDVGNALRTAPKNSTLTTKKRYGKASSRDALVSGTSSMSAVNIADARRFIVC